MIYKMKNGKYRVQIDIGTSAITGERRRITKTAETKKEARRLHQELENHYTAKHSIIDKNLSFTTVKNLYLDEYKLHHKSDYHQIKNYSIDKHILPYFKKCNFKKVTSDDIREFQQSLIDSGLQNKTINNNMIILSEIFNKAIEQRIIDQNPCKNVKNLSIPKIEMNFWTPEQFKAFIDLIGEDEFLFKTFYSLAYLTGMRRGEMVALTWNDVSEFKKEISVRKSLSYVNKEALIQMPKTKMGIRKISINNKLFDLLQEWKTEQQTLFDKLQITHTNETFIFQYRDRPPSKDYFSRNIRTICERGDIEPIRLHDLRHSHVALLINQGEDYTTIKERLGHASIKTTIDVYGHLFPNKQRETADKLDDIL